LIYDRFGSLSLTQWQDKITKEEATKIMEDNPRS